MADLTSQSTSIQSLYNWYREDRLYVNRRYQRKLVWTLEEKQKLIDSILKKYPIPAVLIAEKSEAQNAYEIIDGLQRLHAILSFIENAFPSLDGRYFNVEYFPTAKAQADLGKFKMSAEEDRLTQQEVSTILDYAIALSVMRNATENEINDVFDRINTYGHRLSDQERRQAGVENEFSSTVRDIACILRGDASLDVLLLYQMPAISIDLPKTRHGYDVRADEVFWVSQGILRSTDLRDSMDEQCIADIAACIVGGVLIERSKDALDEIYTSGSGEADRIITALEVYGSKKFSEEFNFCVDEVLRTCAFGRPEKLRDVLFSSRQTNPFPSIFAVLLMAFHELIVREGMVVSNYEAAKEALRGAASRVDAGRKATSPQERRKNIDTIKGLISPNFIKGNPPPAIYGNHSIMDIEAVIRRSEIELANYELKQGLLSLGDGSIDSGMIDKVVKTICAIANNGPNSSGKVIIGVVDKDADAERVKALDGIDPMKVGRRYVVGVNREAARLSISTEDYYARWKDGIKNSALSNNVRDSVLSSMDFNSFYGLGVIVITVPPQKSLSYVGDDLYYREGDSTRLAAKAQQIASLAQRF